MFFEPQELRWLHQDGGCGEGGNVGGVCVEVVAAAGDDYFGGDEFGALFELYDWDGDVAEVVFVEVILQ